MGVLLTSTGLPLLSANRLVAIRAASPVEQLATLVGDLDLVHTAYVGETLPLDFSHNFSGDITDVTPAIAHSVDGTTLLVSPTGTSSTKTYTVTAGVESVRIEMKIVAAPATLAAGTAPPDWTVEVDRPFPRQAWFRHITGGVPPYTYEQVGGPSWLVTRAGGTRGRAPSAPTTATVTVRITDQRGDTIHLSADYIAIAKRSRTPTYTMPAMRALPPRSLRRASALATSSIFRRRSALSGRGT